MRSTTFTAFLTFAVLGCGNTSAQQSQTLEQDWEVQPALWSPRPILIPRSTAVVQDSAGWDTVTLL
ncbi:MAG TPA: hypothetical protein VIM84_15275, partial [Gemmatimonadales bacterium]